MTDKQKLVIVCVFGLIFGLASAILFSLVGMAQAHAEGVTVVKKADLPALKGGKAKAENSPIPTCFGGSRAKLAATDDLVKEWAATHDKHECASASTVYVCRAGKNLSVRCE
jgi:hypothetical protein